MKEKNNKNIIIGTVIFSVLIITALCIFFNQFGYVTLDIEKDFNVSNTIIKRVNNDKEYFIIKKDYEGEYNIFSRRFDRTDNLEEFETCQAMSYDEYNSYCKKWGISKRYNNTELNYIVFSYAAIGPAHMDVRLGGVEYVNGIAKVYVWDDFGGVVSDGCGYAIIVPTDKKITEVEMEVLYTELEYSDISNEKISRLAYTEEENAELVRAYYINSKNDKINQIINKMLDAMSQQHTIRVESKYEDESKSISEYDLITSTKHEIIEDSKGILEIYSIYFDEYFRSYWDMPSGFDINTINDSRNKTLISHIFESVEILVSNTDIKYNYYTLELVENTDIYVVTITIKNKKNKEYGKYNNKETYYINKNTMLLEKIEIESDLSNNTQFYSYSDKKIAIPNNILNKEQNIFTADKPIIYVYPKEETRVNIKLLKEQNITCSYPKYNSEGWNVIAKPNGDLIDIETNRNLYSLYWEGINTIKPRMNEGFVIKGDDSARFLEEKLEILGLNEREAQEFIIYWLPKLENNKYNFIRFQSIDEINSNMPIKITPTPDTVIRIMMEWKGLDKYIEVSEQKLTRIERNGFTVVEWGGTEIN